jgi:hypothetical protein
MSQRGNLPLEKWVAEDLSSGHDADRPRKLILKLRERVSIETGLGTLYARHVSLDDLQTFSSFLEPKADKATTDLRALGTLSLRALVTESSGTDRTPALTEEAYAKLDLEDIKSLASGVAKASELGELKGGDPLEALGSAMFDHLSEQAKRVAESAQQTKKMLDQQFGGISDSVRKSLESSFGGLSSLRDSLKQSGAFESLRRIQEEQESWRKKLADSVGSASSSIDAIRRFEEEQNRLTGAIPKELLSQIQREATLRPAPIASIEAPRIHFPRVEETPMGRAAQASEESALQLKEVAGITAQMADRVAEVTQVVMTKVLPEWFQNLKESAEASKTSLQHAENSLFWAKWALFGSIVATVVMTGLQLWVGRDYQRSNDEQQTRVEKLLIDQLEESRRFNRQLTEESKQLREALERLKGAPTPLPPTGQASQSLRR